MGRVVVRLLANPELLEFWRKRATTDLSWLRVDRVARETTAVYAELLAGAARPSFLGVNVANHTRRQG